MTTHSKLPPSSAARRMACPGSRALEERYGRKEESEASQEGTLAHELAARYLRESQIVGLFQPPGYTQEQYEGAWYYAETVTRFCNNPRSSSVLIETRIDISNVHPDMWGTPDAIIVNHDESRKPKSLHVFDYKFGYTPVDAYENWQLIAYACGIIHTNPTITDIHLHIVQPRDYLSPSKHKVWTLTREELGIYHQRLIISEAMAMSSKPQLRVSDQCKYCSARHACPALKQAAFGATELAFRDTPQDLESHALGTELKLLHEAQELLDFRVTALEAEAQHMLQAGEKVDHYELKPVQGRMTWNVGTPEILELGIKLGINLSKEDTITPTQAIKAGIDESIIVKYAERKQSLKLSKIDLKHSQAVFGKQHKGQTK